MSANLSDFFRDGVIRSYPKGQVLFYPDDSVAQLTYLKSGYVKAYNLLDSGEQRILVLYGPGDVFPLTTFLSGSHVIRFFYEAMTSIEALLLATSDFTRQLSNNMAGAESILRYLSIMDQDFTTQLSAWGGKETKDKILGLLAFLIRKTGHKIKPGIYELGLKITHQDIANLTGMTRESISIHMKELADAGIIIKSNSGLNINLKKLNQRLAT